MQNAAAIPLPVLPEELVGEILLRLPVRSLLQFKCVCKSWKTLISGSQFPLFKRPSTPVKPVTFGYMEEMLDYIIGSCNGLLCMLGTYPHYVGLYNPSLQFKSKISLVPVSVLEQDWFINHCGFGYDKVNDKYKVLVVMERFFHVSPMLTKIYTFGQDDSWKTIPNSPYNNNIKTLGKFVSGTLNWLVSYPNTFVSFDIEKETYRKLLLPQNVGVKTELSVLSDCLCVSTSENVHWVLWMMKEYGVVESWTKFIVIPYHKLLHIFLVEPLFISQNGVLMLLMGRSKLILYNTNTGVALDPLITMELGFSSHIHCESLVSLSC
ncbi:F-box/kelch-repeat protein At3g23880-like [Vicia villosa]|uniref:F-box/kelch-repeat protein At3g23880-like n=1 Tax=Vicia villosa TaxID=3911 RepID=UPI00273C7C46|nr:F-box/kelch-repeat protein At3g23880-like [Vicia villosa]